LSNFIYFVSSIKNVHSFNGAAQLWIFKHTTVAKSE